MKLIAASILVLAATLAISLHRDKPKPPEYHPQIPIVTCAPDRTRPREHPCDKQDLTEGLAEYRCQEYGEECPK